MSWKYKSPGAPCVARPRFFEEATMRIYLNLSAAAIALAASLACLTLPARADDVPTLQVEQVCHGIVNQSGGSLTVGDPKVAFDQCMAGEKADRETMIKEWSTFSAEDKRHCTAETRMGGESSYTEMVTCLEMARDVRNLRNDQAKASSSGKQK
jgi:hypothetical protein